MQKLLLAYYHSENRAISQIWKILPNMVFLRFGGKNGGVQSMRLQVILDSSFARPCSAPIWGGKKGEFRDWAMWTVDLTVEIRLRFCDGLVDGRPNCRDKAVFL